MRILTTAIIIVTVMGCSTVPKQDENWPAKRYYNEARQAQSSGDFQTAIKYFSELEVRYPLSPHTQLAPLEIAYAHYLRGLCYRQLGPTKYAQAKRDFRQAIRKATEKTIKRQAYIALGHIDFESNPPNYESAVEHYKIALSGLEEVPPKDAVLYRLGESLQNIGQWEEADTYLSRCFNDFKQS